MGHEIVDVAYAEQRDPNTHRSLTDAPLRLTNNEAAELAGEVQDLANRWQARMAGQNASRRTYIFLGILVPRPDAQ